MKQTDINRMVDAQNMSPEHKNILRKALGYAIGGDGNQDIQEKLNSLDKEIDTILSNLGSTLGAVTLEVGNDEGVKTRNLAKLKTVTSNNSFFTNINYGFGTASWNNNTGGVAFIITTGGTAKPYSINADGSVAGGIDVDLTNPNTEVFVILGDNEELPTNESEIKGKIYCKKNTSSTAGDNQYNEYIYVKSTKKWEKIGEFQAEPDLSNYARLNNNVVFRSVSCNAGGSNIALNVNGNAYIEYLEGVRRMVGPSYFPSGDFKENMVYSENGGKIDVGIPEDFVFTLEDGSTVTKSIRVISTTSQAGA